MVWGINHGLEPGLQALDIVLSVVASVYVEQLQQGYHWSGKSQGNSRSGKSQGILELVREIWNFVESQGNLKKVREI